ncbi:hypothetical protein HDU67_005303 [Dinochytrium kinnereticum]|nr:hypothetical protein HDU67_005303 [Dinochytrium kinnereticum]
MSGTSSGLAWDAIGNGLILWGLFQGVSTPQLNGELTQEVWLDNQTRIISRSSSTTGFNLNTSVIATLPPINAVTESCVLQNDDDLKEIILAGRFGLVTDDSRTTGIISLDPATGNIRSLEQGLPIYQTGASAILCDQGSQSIWVASPGLPGNIARFSSQVWSFSNYFPGGGLNGRVNQISEVPPASISNGVRSSFLFVGNFSATSESSNNLLNPSFNDRVAFSVTLNNPRDLLQETPLSCPNSEQNGWTGDGGSLNGSLTIEFPHPTNLSGVAVFGLLNSSAVSTFRMTSLPGNVLLDFQDVSSGVECQFCNLKVGIPRQDFVILGTRTDIRALRLHFNSSDPQSVGLNALQFFQQGFPDHQMKLTLYLPDTLIYADSGLNPFRCADRETVARSEANGNWREVSSNNDEIKSLVINFNRNSVPDASIAFFPEVPMKGTYDVFFEWPPCGIFDRCSSRTNVTLEIYKTYERQDPIATVEVDESNPNVSSVKLYSGEFDASSIDDVFVFLRLPNIVSSGSRTLSVVAASVRFMNLSVMRNLNGVVKLNLNPAGSPSWEMLRGRLV